MRDGVQDSDGADAGTNTKGAPHIAINLVDVNGRSANGHRQKSTTKEGRKPDGLKRNATRASLLQTIDKRSQMVIRFDDICAWVPTLVIPGGQGGRMSALLGKCSGKDLAAADQPKQQAAPKERQILYNVSGEVSPGEVLALMGPSGGGKTSLLTLLGGRSTARLEGGVTFNGAAMSKGVKRKLGYVSQDDILFAELTVYETLYFAAMLRLPRGWSRAEKLARVELVVSGLGLGRCRDTIIGGPMMRGVSGGERKRVSIGHELLINPSMLLLDEPTSGLDSTTALRLLHTLRSLATGGRTIVTSIHQPSSRLYRQMDKLMLLSEGRCMYYGDAGAVAAWFTRLGQPCPFGTNIADHILDLANGNVAVSEGEEEGSVEEGGTGLRRRRHGKEEEQDEDEDEEEEEEAEAGAAAGERSASATSASPAAAAAAVEVHRRLVEAFEKRTLGRGPHGIRAEELAALPPPASASPSSSPSCANSGASPSGGSPPSTFPCEPPSSSPAVATVAAAATATATSAAAASPSADGGSGGGLEAGGGGGGLGDVGEDKWGASWIDQVRYLAVRSVKTRRFQSLSHQKFSQLTVVAVLAGLFWWQIGAKLDSPQAVLDVGGLLFFIELFMAFSTLFAALFTFPAEFQLLVKERQSGMYRLSAYYVARTLSDLPMDCLLPSLFTLIVYWMAGLRPDAGAFFSCWASVILIVLTSQSVGLLIGATVVNPQNGQAIATVFMLACMLVGGYYVRGIPVWIAWLKYASLIYWGWNLMLKIEFRHRPLDCGVMAEQLGVGAEQLRQQGAECSVAHAKIFPISMDEGVQKDVCILLAMLLFMRLCIYYALQHKTTFKGGNQRK